MTSWTSFLVAAKQKNILVSGCFVWMSGLRGHRFDPISPDWEPKTKCNNLCLGNLWNMFIPGTSISGAKGLRKTVSIHHPLRFNWHPNWKVLVFMYIYQIKYRVNTCKYTGRKKIRSQLMDFFQHQLYVLTNVGSLIGPACQKKLYIDNCLTLPLEKNPKHACFECCWRMDTIWKEYQLMVNMLNEHTSHSSLQDDWWMN